jgi:hypothetical protein
VTDEVAIHHSATPSYRAACELYLSEPGAGKKVGLSFVSRTALIGAALYLAGERKNLLRYSLVTSGAVEAFVLWWTWSRR